MKEKGFIFEDHTADVQVICWAPTLEEVYAQAAYSLMTVITPDLKKISLREEKIINVKAEDKEALLFDFLSELLYIFDVEGLVFSDITIPEIKGNDFFELTSVLKGEKFDKRKHEIGTEVKAITYSLMKIEKKDKIWEIRVVFDI
ncbi:MAG: archease [Promethearchaeota archaeon]